MAMQPLEIDILKLLRASPGIGVLQLTREIFKGSSQEEITRRTSAIRYAIIRLEEQGWIRKVEERIERKPFLYEIHPSFRETPFERLEAVNAGN